MFDRYRLLYKNLCNFIRGTIFIEHYIDSWRGFIRFKPFLSQFLDIIREFACTGFLIFTKIWGEDGFLNLKGFQFSCILQISTLSPNREHPRRTSRKRGKKHVRSIIHSSPCYHCENSRAISFRSCSDGRLRLSDVATREQREKREKERKIGKEK